MDRLTGMGEEGIQNKAQNTPLRDTCDKDEGGEFFVSQPDSLGTAGLEV